MDAGRLLDQLCSDNWRGVRRTFGISITLACPVMLDILRWWRVWQPMYTPVFQHIPDDWLGRWQLIRRFGSRVYSVKLPEVGRIPDLVHEIEEQLDGKRLSPSMVEWIAFVEDLSSISSRAKHNLTYGGDQTENHPEYAAISLKVWERMWAVAYDDLDHEDPPVGTWGWVQHRDQFVYRKSLPRAPVTQFALHAFASTLWMRWTMMGSDLVDAGIDADDFVELLKAAGVRVSEPFGSLRFIEGRGWVAYVQKGYDMWERRREQVTLKWHGRRSLEDFPKLLREQVGMKRHPREVTQA